MVKRKIIFGNYDTAAHDWTLAAWKLSAAVEKTNYVDKPGGDGSWDLSTALTDGIARYKDRTLTVTLESSEGDRMSREATIREMINTLDGTRQNIELPDDTLHYISGRIHVSRDYNNIVNARVSVTATCEPWKYSNLETSLTLTASSTKKTATLINNGRRAVVPVLTVTGSILVEFGGLSQTLQTGTYKLPAILLLPGRHSLTYSGSGTLVVTYREAVLE